MVKRLCFSKEEVHYSQEIINRYNTMNKKLLKIVAFTTGILSMPVLADLPPARQTATGIDYTSGGVGQPEINQMRELAKTYKLYLTFKNDMGEFYANVDLNIQDANKNTIVDLVSDSLFLVDLPANEYTISATVCGNQTKVINTVVSDKRSKPIVFVWDYKSCL